jgi:hypothetical protein
MSEVSADLEEYEVSRPPRRDNLEMQMPPSYRKELLRRAGYTRGEITDLTKPVNIARAQRARTRETLNLDGVNELVEKISRKTFNVLTLGMAKRSERKFLKPYVVMSKLYEKEAASSRGSRATSPSRSVSSCETASMEFTEPSETIPAASMEFSARPDTFAESDGYIVGVSERDVSPGRDRSALLEI